MFKVLLIFLFVLFSSSNYLMAQFSSGCHTNLEFWYNTTSASFISIVNTDKVSAWNDFQTVDGSTYNLSYNSLNASTWPTLISDDINGYDAVNFSSGKYLRNLSVTGTDFRVAQAMTIYSVIKTTSGNNIFAHGDGTARVIFQTNALYWGSGYSSNANPAGNRDYARKLLFNSNLSSSYEIRSVSVSLDIADSLHTVYSMYNNGKQIQTKTAQYAKSVTSQTDTFIMGAYRGSPSFVGNIAELMVFKDGHDLQPAKRARLVSYLSLKYGISLDNSGGQLTYVDHNNKDIWPYSTQCGTEGSYSTYSNRITGIFRDISCYNITHLKSINFESDEAILQGAYTEVNHNFDNPDNFNKNRQFFLWGDNNGTKTFSTNGNSLDVPTGSGITRMERKWKVRETINTTGTPGTIEHVTFEFDLSGTDIPSGLDITEVFYIIDTDKDGSFTDETAVNPNSWNGTTKIGRFEYNYSQCDVITFGITTAALPVTWASFEAFDQNNHVELNWVTATELNNSHFEIERSENGVDWLQIGMVSGNGTVTGNSYYNFADKNPEVGYNYYRIKQVDFDGKYAYSKVEVVAYTNGVIAQSNIFPNPSNDKITVEIPFNLATVQMQIVDLSGNVVLTNVLNKESNELDISMLNKGVYLVVLQRDNGKMVHRLVVN